MSQSVVVESSQIDELLSRSVQEIIPGPEALRARLLSGERLRIYIGTDATGTSLHLGHATNYMILEKFRRLGHEVIFLVGDFTSRIGDPTDKSDAARKQLTREEVVHNVETWTKQVAPLIGINDPDNPVQIRFNHDWLAALTFEDIIHLAANFTVQHMIERDMFERRIEAGEPLYLHELFYPLMQGYDSVAMDVDVELCGSDQKFNALAGRTLQRKLNNKEKFVFITTLLENPKTGEKMMSKSQGTGVFLDADAPDMYGAVMAQPDENMHQLFVDCTWLPLAEIERIERACGPRDAKMRLAQEIVSIFHGQAAATAAEASFVATFQHGQVPTELPEIVPEYGSNLVAAGIVSSKHELNRLLSGGAIKEATTLEKLTELPVNLREPMVVKIGKRKFVRLLPHV